jgi:hypothetical protein
MDLGPVGVLAAVILLVQTVIAAISASRNRHLSARSKRLTRVEPAYLDLVDWAYQVQVWASGKGQLKSIPPLPQSVRGIALDEESEMQAELEALKRQAAKRHDRDPSRD